MASSYPATTINFTSSLLLLIVFFSIPNSTPVTSTYCFHMLILLQFHCVQIGVYYYHLVFSISKYTVCVFCITTAFILFCSLIVFISWCVSLFHVFIVAFYLLNFVFFMCLMLLMLCANKNFYFLFTYCQLSCNKSIDHQRNTYVRLNSSIKAVSKMRPESSLKRVNISDTTQRLWLELAWICALYKFCNNNNNNNNANRREHLSSSEVRNVSYYRETVQSVIHFRLMSFVIRKIKIAFLGHLHCPRCAHMLSQKKYHGNLRWCGGQLPKFWLIWCWMTLRIILGPNCLVGYLKFISCNTLVRYILCLHSTLVDDALAYDWINQLIAVKNFNQAINHNWNL